MVFADFGDRLSFSRGGELKLTVRGPSAAQAGEDAKTISCSRRRARLPGVARRPSLAPFVSTRDCRSRPDWEAGRPTRAQRYGSWPRRTPSQATIQTSTTRRSATGADVPVCLDPRPRIMRGIGEMLSAPLALPKLPALLVNPGVALPTKAVFAEWMPTVSTGLPLISMRLQSFQAAIKFCNFSARNRTISNRRRSRFSRSSPECSRRCANCQDAGSPACRDQVRLALPFSPPPRRRANAAKVHVVANFRIGG